MNKIALIGVGNMGGAIAGALCKGGGGKQLIVTRRNHKEAAMFAAEHGCSICESNLEAAMQSAYIVCCVPPQVMPDVLRELAPCFQAAVEKGERKVLISIAAGVTIDTIRSIIGYTEKEVPIIRIMPNSPVEIGKGLTLISYKSDVDDAVVDEVNDLLEPTGALVFIDEAYFNIAGTMSGCTPAYVYMFIEGLAKGGVRSGLTQEQAVRFAAQTVLGAAAMVLESGKDTTTLRDAVCTPGGTTIEGVYVLDQNRFTEASADAICAAYKRTVELS